ncbi:MAG: hypothetical protein J6U54_19120 [Clostridiales bacterium]|nr:hypothetical protein [Clostridiales bacterium]
MNTRSVKLSKSVFIPIALMIALLGLILILPTNKVLADGEQPASIEVNGKTFYLQDDGWYVYKESDTLSYRLLTQEMINNDFRGGLPTVSEDETEEILYMLGSDVTVTSGTKFDTTAKRIAFNLNSFTIDYTDQTSYFCDATADVTCDGWVYFTNGVIKSNGAPMFLVDAGRCDMTHLLIQGNATSYNVNGNRAITCKANGDLYFMEVSISNFSSEYGGAVFSGDGTDMNLTGLSIDTCFADKGGAVYSTGKVQLGNNEIKNNTAQSLGGAICLEGSNGTCFFYSGNTAIYGNSCIAANGGGGIYCGAYGIKEYACDIWSAAGVQVSANFSNGAPSNIYFKFREVNDAVYIRYGIGTDTKLGISASSYTNGDRFVIASQGFDKNINIDDRITCDDPSYKLYLDDYKDYTYSSIRVIEKSTDSILIEGMSLVLDSTQIGIKMYVYVPEGEYADSLKWDARLSAYGNEKFYAFDGELICSNDSIVRDRDLITFTFPIDPTDMTVPLQFDLSYDNNQVLTYKDFTVQDYADAILSHPVSYNYRNYQRTAALIRYGSASQKYFGFRTDDLADSILDTKHTDVKAKLDAFEIENIYQGTSNSTFNIYSYTDSIKVAGVSALFGSKPVLKFYFLADEGVTPVFVGYNSEEYKATRSGSYYVIKIPFSSLGMSDSTVVTAYPKDCEDIRSNCVECYGSLYAYLYQTYYSDKSSAKMKDLSKSLMIYMYSLKDAYGGELWTN